MHFLNSVLPGVAVRRSLTRSGAVVLVTALGAFANAAAAQTIEQSRGADQTVDYASLAEFAPWDDRNYRLTREDLDLLAKNEAELDVPIPAFFRVELRREFKHLRREGMAQYPRAAVPLFYRRHGGLMIDGRIERGEEGTDHRGTVPINGEVKLNQVLGANEVTIEINQAQPQFVIAGSNNNGGQEMYYSEDGGQTWTIQGVLPNTCCDPTVGWSSDGEVAYVAALSGSIGVSFWRSFDKGQTWVDRFDLTPSGSDKEFLHVDISETSPYKDNIYITYHNGNTMQFARSTDQGLNWDITAFPAAPSGIGSDITTDRAGNIYYFYGAFGTQTVTMLKSTDGGETFEAPVAIANTNGAFDWPVPSMESRNAWIYAATDADRSMGAFDGTIYVSWADTLEPETGNPVDNHTKVVVAYSRDGGSTWGFSTPHDTRDNEFVDRYNPWLTVDQNGVVHVVFYDTRNSDARTGVDLYYNFSLDGGVSWAEPARISPETSANLTDGQEWGDYNGVSVLFEKVLAVWTDNRDGPPNSKDVYSADIVNITGEPTFLLSASNTNQQLCTPGDLADIAIEVGQVQEFTNPVTLTTIDLPTGFGASFSNNPVTPATPPGMTTLSVSTDASVSSGDYSFTVNGSAADADDRGILIRVAAVDDVPAVPRLLSPMPGATDQAVTPEFAWTNPARSGSFLLEVDDNDDFSSPEYTAVIEDETTHRIDGALEPNTEYFWRIRSTNICGDGDFTPASSFTTANIICAVPNLSIPDGNPGGTSDTLGVAATGDILDLKVVLNVTHTYVGDLLFRLTNETSNVSVVLADRPGFPDAPFGCSGSNIAATFTDESTTPVEDVCLAGPAAIAGDLQPEQPLSAFDGSPLNANWTLFVSDNAGQDIGTVDSWCLQPVTDSIEPDTDGDGIVDSEDNCIDTPNPDQRDTDGDGFGNICDADLDNDGIVNMKDVGMLREAFFTAPGDALWNPDADFDGDDAINFTDLGVMRQLFLEDPGPSGLVP